MKLQTHIPLNKTLGNPISYPSKILMLGSCFVEHMGEKLEYYKFQVSQNPFGIIFHPEAICNLVERAIKEHEFSRNDLFEYEGVWSSFFGHSNLNQSNSADLLDQMNASLIHLNKQIKEATHIVFSFGTAWGYRLLANKQLVANCHKQSQSFFKKELMSIEDLQYTLKKMMQLIKTSNEHVEIIFTVSPVRHLKDGLIENSLSKSHLLSAVHAVKNDMDRVHYFPSYEILMDELRDYRFYKKDMIHPSELAVDIIWNAFKNVWLSETDYALMNTIAHVNSRLNHKALHPDSKAHMKFLKRLEEDILAIEKKYDFISFKA